MNQKKKSKGALWLFYLTLVMGLISTAQTILMFNMESMSFLGGFCMVYGCLLFFVMAGCLYWEYRADKKYDVLIEQEERERERQIQGQTTANQH